VKLVEVQVDRLVGPTHHFGGLGVGNIASLQHAGEVSHPASAALQGLDKMRLVASFGVPQVVLPPQPRPDLSLLRALGFNGSDAEILKSAFEQSPEQFSAAMSCSAMWTANAGTVTPAIDSRSNTTNLFIANLVSSLHRAIEPSQTIADLRQALPAQIHVHEPLPGGTAMRDEGAANHMRLGTSENQAGIHLFVYGDGDPKPNRFWPRQTLAASQAISRRHQIAPENTFFCKQHPLAIDAGAFHNDVVALSHGNLLIHHELAFATDNSTWLEVEHRFQAITGAELKRIEISSASLSLEAAVSTYLFNSQIVMPEQSSRPVILCPMQVREHAETRKLVKEWCQRGLFREACYVPLDQSMRGGGGPACLRLRVPLPEDQLSTIPAASRWTEELDDQLRAIIRQYYPAQLTLSDLANGAFAEQNQLAYEQIRAVFSGS
jgi:succinylarginine dihydrolase